MAFETVKSRAVLVSLLAIFIVSIVVPGIIGLTTGRFDLFIYPAIAILVLCGVIAVGVRFLLTVVWWITDGDRVDHEVLEPENIRYIDVAKTPEAIPAGTIINILEMWPASAEVWIQNAQTQKMVRVKDLSYDRDYHRIIIRESGV